MTLIYQGEYNGQWYKPLFLCWSHDFCIVYVRLEHTCIFSEHKTSQSPLKKTQHKTVSTGKHV